MQIVLSTFFLLILLILLKIALEAWAQILLSDQCTFSRHSVLGTDVMLDMTCLAASACHVSPRISSMLLTSLAIMFTFWCDLLCISAILLTHVLCPIYSWMHELLRQAPKGIQAEPHSLCAGCDTLSCSFLSTDYCLWSYLLITTSVCTV